MRKNAAPLVAVFAMAGALFPEPGSSGELHADEPRAGGRPASIAVFRLGGDLRGIPPEAVAKADRGLRRLFSGIGSLVLLSLDSRLGPGELEDLAIGLSASAAAVSEDAGIEAPGAGSPEAGARRLGKEELGLLSKADLAASPSIGRIDTYFDDEEGRWESDLTAKLDIWDLRIPRSLGEVEVEASGCDDGEPELAAAQALGKLPLLLQSEIDGLDAFRPGLRLVEVSKGRVVLDGGRGAGAVPGDEYELPGGCALAAITEAGPDSAVGEIAFGEEELRTGDRLAKVPRLGVDLETYLRFFAGPRPDLAIDRRPSSGPWALVGLRCPVSAGFSALRPYLAVQVPAAGVRGFGPAFLFPAQLLAGLEYRGGRGRIALVPCCGAGAGFFYASRTIYGQESKSSETAFSHFGGQAYLHLAFLASRDVRLFAELGGEYWISAAADLYTDYGGVGFGAGVAIKL